MTNKGNKQKNNRHVPNPDLEYIVFKGNANEIKKRQIHSFGCF